MNELIISVFIVTGSLWILIAAIGLMRFKDLYSRIHASTKATSLGLFLTIIGVTIYFASWMVALKLSLIIIFIYLTSPLAGHSIAKSYKNDRDSKKLL
ncbi:MAG: monovalent cation/H(+) antiporter subunit G [Bacteroidales bacterium]|nr:monovalent cation/H(+) antiporter subunit G [Bacteroidales bacterium]